MRRSKHTLSHSRLASFDMGQLVPCACVEVLPGDTFRHSTSVLLRLASLANPVMHEIDLRVHHWYVPTRIAYEHFVTKVSTSGADTWDNWINNISTPPGLRGFDLDAGEVTAGTLANHLGLPVGLADNTAVNRVPFWAYQLIWSNFYRDQQIDSEVVSNASENDLTSIRRICWEKDYFTTCREDPQYGDEVNIPLQGYAAVEGIGVTGTLPTIGSQANVREPGAVRTYPLAIEIEAGTNNVYFEVDSDVEASAASAVYAHLNNPNSDASVNINELRRAIALQKFLEARNRYGHRYRDYLKYLGVRPSDGRLEEPQYLGGGRQTVAVSEVLATAEGTGTDVGDMAGHGIAALRTRPYTQFFEEHGFVISLMSVRPRSMYQNMVPRHWFKDLRDDIWQKEYEMFGPQQVLDKEVYGPHTNETDVFGYQSRFAEYRYVPSQVSGLFSTTYDDWHMAREFSGAPNLDEDFVHCTPTDRVYNDGNSPECLAQVRHKIVARRLVSGSARV